MKPAPDFSLADQDGDNRSLADYAGKWLVLYFYPKDDTPGCTTEACSFRDEREAITELGHAEVAGISKDTVKSHKKFVDKYGLNFTLLSDPEHKTIKAYGSWKSKKLYGRDYMGTERNTFIINPDGMITGLHTEIIPLNTLGQPMNHWARQLSSVTPIQFDAAGKLTRQ